MKTVFEYACPEEVGLFSSEVKGFIDDLEQYGVYMHSIMIVRFGKIIAEGYWKPFHKDFRHRMYSVSKTFVGAAIGLLEEEGKIKLSDKICKYFPEYPEDKLHPYIKDTTIYDLLIMSSPFELSYTLHGNGRNRTHWVESFFTMPPIKPPGTVFCYDTTASFMLNVLVERLVGKPFMDYLYEKSLHKLNFSKNVRCIKSPDGYSWGGSGVLCTTLDLAKFAHIYMRGGVVNGEEILPPQFVKDSIRSHVATDTFAHGGEVFKTMGYGYQIQMTNDNGFVFNGLGNQHAFCYPDKDLMVITTADNQGKHEDADRVIRLAIKYRLLKNCNDEQLPENKKDFEKLTEKLNSLSLIVPKGEKKSDFMETLNGVTYKLDDNPQKMEWVRFEFEDNKGTMFYKNARGEKALSFGLGEYLEGELPEPQYSGETIDTPLGRGYKCVGVGVWPDEKNLLLRFNVIDDYIGNLTFYFGFKDDKIGFRSSVGAEAFLEDYVGLAGGVIAE